jgi:hypothetical protein
LVRVLRSTSGHFTPSQFPLPPPNKASISKSRLTADAHTGGRYLKITVQRHSPEYGSMTLHGCGGLRAQRRRSPTIHKKIQTLSGYGSPQTLGGEDQNGHRENKHRQRTATLEDRADKIFVTFRDHRRSTSTNLPIFPQKNQCLPKQFADFVSQMIAQRP